MLSVIQFHTCTLAVGDVTVTVAVAVWCCGLGLFVVWVSVTVFDICVPVFVACIFIFNQRSAPLIMLLMFHVSVFPFNETVGSLVIQFCPWLVLVCSVVGSKFRVDGMISVRITPVALSGPQLWACMNIQLSSR